MKTFLLKFILMIAAVLCTAEVMAQVPQGFNFQAVARNADGDLIKESALGVRISILKGSETGTAVYTETQKPKTNAAGSFQLVIGEGTTENDFSAIDWSSDNYFVKLEIDPAGGTEYETLGTTRLLSVPYALLAHDVVNKGTEVEGIKLPLELKGKSGHISVSIGTFGINEDFGYMQLSDKEGNSRVRMSVSHDSTGTTTAGFLGLDHSNGTNSRLYPHSLYFDYAGNQTNSPLGWFGTLGSASGFSQLLNFDPITNEYKGGILTGFWPGHAALLMENGNEIPGVWLANDDGGGKLVLYSPDGGENIQMGGKSWENSSLPFMYFRGTANTEGEPLDLLWMEAQKWEDGTELGSITLRGTDGSEFTINSHGIADDGEAVTNGNFQNVSIRNEHDKELIALYASNDPNGNDPGGWAGELFLWGNDSPNIQMGGEMWANTNLPHITLFGNKPNGDGWYYSHLNLVVEEDGEDQFGSFMLNANDDVPNFRLSAKSWLNAELPIFEMYGSQANPEGGYFNHITMEVHEDGSQQWAGMALKGNAGKTNIELGAKNWEDPNEGAGRPYMGFQGNSSEDNRIFVEVIDDGTNEYGNISLSSTDGANLTINAHGIDGNLHVEGDITHTGTITQTSDRSLKENIEELENALNTVMQLNPTTYNFKGEGEYNGLKLATGQHFGLIAQEVEEILPDLVKTNTHTYSENGVSKTMDYKSMNYTELIPLLIKAVQEQQQEIEQLKAELENIKQ